MLREHFGHVDMVKFDDAILIDKADPLIEYILSCHGNQNQYLLDKYQDFRQYVKKQVKGQYHITKEAGYFLCHK